MVATWFLEVGHPIRWFRIKYIGATTTTLSLLASGYNGWQTFSSINLFRLLCTARHSPCFHTPMHFPTRTVFWHERLLGIRLLRAEAHFIPFRLFLSNLMFYFSLHKCIWFVKSNRRERDKHFTMINSSEHIFCESREIGVWSRTAKHIRNYLIAPQSLTVSLKKGAIPSPRQDVEVTFDGLADRTVSWRRPASKLPLTQFRSSALLECSVRKRITDIKALEI